MQSKTLVTAFPVAFRAGCISVGYWGVIDEDGTINPGNDLFELCAARDRSVASDPGRRERGG